MTAMLLEWVATSIFLILTVLALRAAFGKRVSARLRYALWAVVLVRLLVPVQLFTSPLAGTWVMTEQRVEHNAVDLPTAPIITAPAEGAPGLPVTNATPGSVPTPPALPDAPEPPEAPDLRNPPDWVVLLGWAWLAGSGALALVLAASNLRFARRLRRVRIPLEGADCPLPVYVAAGLPSPCLLGLLRPAVYVTPEAAADPAMLRHVIAHEYTHFRHGDHIWSLLRCGALAVHWWNPLVWVSARLSRRDTELACDEGALRRLGDGERLAYGNTLLALVTARPVPGDLLRLATTMAGDKKSLKERFTRIARAPKRWLWAAVAVVLVTALASACAFGQAEDKSAAQGLTADTLQERLLDLPAELESSVEVRASETKAPLNDIALASYWWDVPADWESERAPWLLDVHREERGLIDANGWPAGNGDLVRETFARDEAYYYTIERPMDARFQMADAEPFTAAYQAVRAFAEKTVLDTEGVEPYSQDENLLPPDTLQARLADIPEELLGEVALFGKSSDYPEDTPLPEQHSVDLAFYLLDNPISPEGWEGWLLTVRRLDQVGFEDWLYSVGALRTGIFARDSEHYYMVSWPTSVQYGDEDASRYAAASKAIWDYAKEQVLGTEGVEPYDPSELREREYLWEGKTYTDVAYWPYKNVNGNTDIVWILRLVQLAEDGKGGVWIPERWQCIDTAVDPTPQHVKPDEAREMGLTVTQYARYLQGEADAGRADWATDPIRACLHYAQTDFGHRNVTAGCFTRDAGYIQSALEKLKPSPGQRAVQAAVDRLLAEPGIRLTLAPSGLTSHVYAYTTDPGEDYYISRLADLATDFRWEEAPYSGSPEAGSLQISTEDGAVSLILLDGSYLMLVRQDGEEAKCYKGLYRYWDQPDYLAYDHLRWWFDHVEVETLRAPILSVPDAGQSHEEIARAWAEGYEGVYTKTAPGSQYACTSMKIVNLKADLPDWLESGELEEFARSHGFAAEDFGKTWFGFSYETVFVPVDQSTANGFFVGNTAFYEGEDAPEGALTYSRVGFIRLTDEGWTCTGTGTGW